MVKAFDLSIMTPDKMIYEGKTVSLVVPSESGYIGVLANHAPLVTNLSAGTITVRSDSGVRLSFRAPDKGFLEVLKNNATIFLNTF
ncbi:MAG: F0F1 ATP synthase subunit epsilon [Candidatus Omnitrophota bacterium]